MVKGASRSGSMVLTLEFYSGKSLEILRSCTITLEAFGRIVKNKGEFQQP